MMYPIHRRAAPRHAGQDLQVAATTQARWLATTLFTALLSFGIGCQPGVVVDGSGAHSTGGGGSGGTGSGGEVCTPVDDQMECTDDACNPDGTTAHPPRPAGTPCGGGSSTCDGSGACVGPACNGVLGLPGVPVAPVGDSPVALVAADLNGDGNEDFAVANKDSLTVSVLLGAGNGTFAGKVDYPLDAAPTAIAAADMDGDGLADLAVACGDTVRVLLNTGNGTFAGGVDYPAFGESIVAADMDGDGLADLAVSYHWGDLVRVLLNAGNGTFAGGVDYPVGQWPASLGAGDVDGDGLPDLVVNYDSMTVSVLLNLGNGTFAGKIDSAYDGPSGGGESMVMADLNGDSLPDVATTGGQNGLRVLFSVGDGTFVDGGSYLYGTNEKPGGGTAAADLNGDGALDLAVAFHGYNRVKVLENLGNGTFVQKGWIDGAVAPCAIASADLNGDGQSDILVAHEDSAFVNVLLHPGGDWLHYAALQNHIYFNPGALVAADLNGDGTADLAAANNMSDAASVSVLLTDAAGALPPEVNYPMGLGPSGVGAPGLSLAAIDLNGDGATDIVVANPTSSRVSVLSNQGDGTFAPRVDYPLAADPGELVATDLDGHGLPDLAVANLGADTVSVLLNQGDGTFASEVVHAVNGGPFDLAAADLNGDGANDLVVTTATSIGVLWNQGDGAFAPPVDYPLDTPRWLAAADLNGDGAPDLAFTSQGQNGAQGPSLSVLFNQGNGTFGGKVDLPEDGDLSSLAAVDMNGDGQADLVVSNQTHLTVDVFLNQGGGTFAGRLAYAGEPTPSHMTVADMNADGRPDLAISASFTYSAGVGVVLNTCWP